MARKTDIVVTTIFEPAWLSGYTENLRRHGHAGDVTIRIICDRKTPPSVPAAAAAARRDGFDVDCPTLDEQTDWLRQRGLPADFIPWDSDNRRNIGFLRAWESGAQVLISIDDDNYCRADSDFVAEHHVVGRPAGATGLRCARGAPWFNACGLLDLGGAAAVFPRGYPFQGRVPAQQAALSAPTPAESERLVAINAGLWLDDPDVDALTRLVLAPRARAAQPGAVVLAAETWSPINTQNTGLMREALPAYYYVRMGHALQGLTIDRFGDILSGYFAQKCAKHLGHVVRLGTPVADHRRTPHNLFKDLYHELAGLVLIEELLPWLMQLRLTGSTYAQAYAALADALAAQAPHFKGFVWDQGGREFLSETARRMQRWLAAL